MTRSGSDSVRICSTLDAGKSTSNGKYAIPDFKIDSNVIGR